MNNPQKIATCLIQHVAPVCRGRGVEYSELDIEKSAILFAAWCCGAWDKHDVRIRVNQLCDIAIKARVEAH